MAIRAGKEVVLRTFQGSQDAYQTITLTYTDVSLNSLGQYTIDLSKYIIDKTPTKTGYVGTQKYLGFTNTQNTVSAVTLGVRNSFILTFQNQTNATFTVTFSAKALGAEVLKGRSVSITESQETVDVTTFQDQYEKFAPGLKSAEVEIEFFEFNSYVLSSINNGTPIIMEYYMSLNDAPLVYSGVIVKSTLKSEAKSAQTKTITFKGERISG